METRRQIEEVLAKLYRSLEKWRRAVLSYIGSADEKIVADALSALDAVLREKRNGLSSLAEKYAAIEGVLSSTLLSVVRNDETMRLATAGQSSSGELSISTLVVAIESAMEDLQKCDVVQAMRDDLANVTEKEINEYLADIDDSTISVFDAILIGYTKNATIRHRLSKAIEAAKNDALSAHFVEFPEEAILTWFARETAYSTEKDVVAAVDDAAKSFNDLSPCAVIYRVVGSQYYFNSERLLTSRSDPAAGLTKKFVSEHATITELPMTTESRIEIRFYGSGDEYMLFDTLDGINFARLSYRGAMKVPAAVIVPGRRISRESAYHSAMSERIINVSHNPRAKTLISEYKARQSAGAAADNFANALRAHFRANVNGMKNREAYLRAMADRPKIMRVLKTASAAGAASGTAGAAGATYTSLASILAMERKIAQFEKKYEKSIHALAPTDKEINSAANAETVLEAAFNAALDQTMKYAEKNKTLVRPVETLVEYAIINSY